MARCGHQVEHNPTRLCAPWRQEDLTVIRDPGPQSRRGSQLRPLLRPAPYSAPPPRRPRPGREGPPRAQGNPSEERTPLPRRPGKEGGARMRSGQRPTPHCSFQTGRRRLAAGTCWRKSCWLVLIGRATQRTSHPAKLQLPERPLPSHQLCGFSPNYAMFFLFDKNICKGMLIKEGTQWNAHSNKV